MDLKYAIRQFSKNPAFTLVAILTLSFGIGANTALFSFVNAWIIRPLPYPDPSRLAAIFESNARTGVPNPVAPADFKDWRAQCPAFQELAAYDEGSFILAGGDEPVQLEGFNVTSNFFRTLGVQPAIGRDFTPAEETPGNDHVVILSHELWRDRFASDPHILGRTVTIDSVATTVIGVMPESFHFLLMGRAKLWAPLALPPELANTRKQAFLSVLGRVRADTKPATAAAALTATQDSLARAYPATNQNRGVVMRDLHEEFGRETGNDPLKIVFGLVTLILLMACSNIASLAMARAAGRRREMAVRLAIGAGRWRLIRQLITETVLLFLAGAAGGILLAQSGTSWLTSIIPYRNRGYLPNYGAVEIDATVLAFTLGVALITGMVFGLAPALEGTRFDVNGILKAGAVTSSTRSGARFRKILVSSEVALAIVVVICSALLGNSFVRMMSVDPGFRADRVLAASAPLSPNYSTPDRIRGFYEEVVAKLSALPGVERASASQATPFLGGFNTQTVLPEGELERPAGQEHVARVAAVMPGYLETMSIPLISGRTVARSDSADAAPVVVIGETLAAREFGAQNPLGRKIRLGARKWFTVAGVVRDVFYFRVTQPRVSQAYTAFAQNPNPAMTLVVRTSGDSTAAAQAIRAVVRSVDPNQPVTNISSITNLIDDSYAPQRILTQLTVFFGAVALFLAAIGIYGVMAYSVGERTREIGVRMALGAARRDVLGLVIGQGVWMVAGGALAGIAGALALGGTLRAMLFGVGPNDPLTLIGAILALGVVAIAACWLPARRATRVDPLVALRHE